MRNSIYIFAALLFVVLISCKREDPTLGDPPSIEDAQFTATPSAANANIIEFAASSTDMRYVWDLGNGLTANGSSVTGVYPNAGTYTVTLMVFNRGGSQQSIQEIVINQTDPTLLDDPLYNSLTGGANGPGSKTWVIDSANAEHFGVGPDPIGAAGNFPEWWAAQPGDKAGVGLYDDRYVFTLNGFQFDMVNNGDVYVHNSLSADFPGSYENLGDYTAPYNDLLGETWTLTFDPDTSLTVSGNSFLGMYTGVRTYKILHLNDTSMSLQYKHHDGGLHWYLHLIPEGFVPNSGGGGNQGGDTYTLPLDFENDSPTFTTFGGSTYQTIANPDPSGINTSGNVLETVHGNETWAGLFVDLTNPLDFSSTPNIVFKLWAPMAGDVRVKVENSANTNDFVEIDATVNSANTWEEISVDFSAATSGVYDRVVLFPGWNVANAGTFYLDDIGQQ